MSVNRLYLQRYKQGACKEIVRQYKYRAMTEQKILLNDDAVTRIWAVILSTDFKRNPYRGILSKVAKDLGIKLPSLRDRMDCRNLEAGIKIYREIGAVQQMAQEVLQ